MSSIYCAKVPSLTAVPTQEIIMDRVRIKEQAKKVITGSGKWYVLLAIIIAAVIPAIPSTIISSLAAKYDSVVLDVLSPIVSIVCAVLEMLFAIGLCTYVLRMLESNDHDVKSLFSGFRSNWFEMLKANLLAAVYIILGTICFIIPGILMALRYSQINYFFAENPNASYKEAMTASKEMMQGKRGKLFGLNFSFFFWYLLVGITFGIAAIYVAPYVAVSNAIFHNEVKPKAVINDDVQYRSPYDSDENVF